MCNWTLSTADTHETLELDVWPGRPHERVRVAIADWLTQHGIDPKHVPCQTTIVRDLGRFQVTVREFAFDAFGCLIRDADGSARLVVVVYHGEGPPVPFPDLPRCPPSTPPTYDDPEET